MRLQIPQQFPWVVALQQIPLWVPACHACSDKGPEGRALCAAWTSGSYAGRRRSMPHSQDHHPRILVQSSSSPLLASSPRVGGIRRSMNARDTLNKASPFSLRHYHAYERTTDLSKGETITTEWEAVWAYKPAFSFVHTPFLGR